MVKKIRIFLIVSALLLTFHCSNASADIYVEIILDGSGSMWETIGDEYKIGIIKDTLTSYLNKVPENVQIGLRVFGSRIDKDKTIDDCQNTRLIQPITSLNKEEFLNLLKKINPKGKSPLAFAIKEAFKDFKETEEKKVIIAIADGPDTCQHLACKWLDNEVKKSLKIPVHILGYRITTDRAHNQLYCIASKLNGQYFKVNSQRAIERQLKKLVEKTMAAETARLEKIDADKKIEEEIRQKTRLEIIVTNNLDPLYGDSIEIVNPLINGSRIEITSMHISQGKEKENIYSKIMNEGSYTLTIGLRKIRGASKVEGKREEIPFTIERGKTTHIHLTTKASLLQYSFQKDITVGE